MTAAAQNIVRQEGGADWLAAFRARGEAIFAAQGLPHRRIEAWKYSDLAARLRDLPAPARPGAAAPALGDPFAGLAQPCLTFLDGRRSGGQALPDGLESADLADGQSAPAWLRAALAPERLQASRPLVALSAARATGGVALRVPAGLKLTAPIHVRQLGAAPASAAHLYHVIVVEAGAHLTLVESQAGAPGGRFANTAMDIFLGEGATLDHVRIQAEAEDATIVSFAGVTLSAGARYDAFALAAGAGFSRAETAVAIVGAGAQAHATACTVLGDGCHADHTVWLDHAAPGASSRQSFRSALFGKSRVVTQGKVTVREGAQQTDAHQLMQALLLSPGAEADAKPELEIYADDVKCGHGATAGELDADALFYLRSRGLPEPLARTLLIEAFLAGSIEAVADPRLRDAVHAHLTAALHARAEGQG